MTDLGGFGVVRLGNTWHSDWGDYWYCILCFLCFFAIPVGTKQERRYALVSLDTNRTNVHYRQTGEIS